MSLAGKVSCGRRSRLRRILSGQVLVVIAACSSFGLSRFYSQAAPAEAQPTPQTLVLTNVKQILDLGPDRARKFPHPTHLRGAIIFFNPKTGFGFLHDGTACILISLTNSPPELTTGKSAEIEGWSESGVQAPMVGRAQARVLGDCSLPAPTRIPVARMKAGEGCWQWVHIEGVVRDMNRDLPNLALSVAAEGQRFSAFILGYDQFSRQGLPLDWLEARVAIDGICWTDVNDQSQVLDFHLVLNHTNQIRLLRPGTTNIFSQLSLRPGDAARLHVPSDNRLKITGTVLTAFGNDRLFLRTPFGPVQARLFPPISRGMPTTELVPRPLPQLLRAGDRIELVGAPSESKFAPLLIDAEYQRVAAGPSPVPTPASAGKLTNGRYDADLVRIVGRLLTRERRQLATRTEDVLVLEAGNTVFEATWQTDATNALTFFPGNARLELTGLCLTQPGLGNLRRTFKILLRNPVDVRYLGQTHFWSQAGASRILGVGAALGMAGILWVLLLRRQVTERTAELAAANLRLSGEIEEKHKAQTELKRALAAERELGELKSRFVSLVSHEFRTPLGITMSAVELLRNYLDRLPPEKLKELLDDIYSATLRMSGLMEQVLLLGRVEARKLAVNGAPLDLKAFGDKLVSETLVASNHKCPINLSANGDLAGAQGDESLLRHILSNLLSNAVKYSPGARAVDFIIQRENRDAVFTVRDRGIGIPQADQARLFEAFHRAGNVGQISGTGLGLLIVKRCIELHQGSIGFDSKVNEGTTFIVRLPLFAE